MKINYDEFKLLLEELVDNRLNERSENDMTNSHKEVKSTYKDFSRAIKQHILNLRKAGYSNEADHLESLFNSGVNGFMVQINK